MYRDRAKAMLDRGTPFSIVMGVLWLIGDYALFVLLMMSLYKYLFS